MHQSTQGACELPRGRRNLVHGDAEGVRGDEGRRPTDVLIASSTRGATL